MLLYARSFDIHPRVNAQTNQRHLAFERQSINVYTPWERREETLHRSLIRDMLPTITQRRCKPVNAKHNLLLLLFLVIFLDCTGKFLSIKNLLRY